MSPSLIHYHLITTHLGVVLIARRLEDICFVHIEDDVEILKRSLCEAFPASDISLDSGTSTLEQTVHTLISGAQSASPLSLHLGGTPFQQKVWRAIQSIPTGESRTYSDLAKMINHPTAVRAVASACARNQIALLIPCHRVVRTDGTLGGYRWGLDRKRALLQAERRLAITRS